ILAVVLNMKKNHEIELKFKGFRPSKLIIARIYSVGVPSIMMAAIGSVMTFGINKILISFTTTATAVFGVYFKLQSFVFMPIFGLNNGMVPIIAYNYGARKPERLTKTIKLSIAAAVLIMVIGFVLFQTITEQLLMIFNASDNMLEIGVPALRIISICFLLAGFSIISSSLFQALSHGLLSLFVSLLRQLLILLPAAYLLSLSGKLNLIWWAFPLAELFAAFLCALFLRYIYKKEIKPMYETV
ncbi:MATE family efflux transporter, partial [Emergencia timonensis]